MVPGDALGFFPNIDVASGQNIVPALFRTIIITDSSSEVQFLPISASEDTVNASIAKHYLLNIPETNIIFHTFSQNSSILERKKIRHENWNRQRRWRRFENQNIIIFAPINVKFVDCWCVDVCSSQQIKYENSIRVILVQFLEWFLR